MKLRGVYCYCYWNELRTKILFRITEPVSIAGHVVPRGFETDFASIPRALRWLIPTVGRYNLAALIHDYLYDNRIKSRQYADRVFLYVMIKSGVTRVKAYTMYYAVRLFGTSHWNR